MRRNRRESCATAALGAITGLLVASLPLTAAAGGNEFPSGGVRDLGRGATGFTRADDPTVMARNPALLADLWDDQAMTAAQFLLVDSCFNPTGNYGYRTNAAAGDVIDAGGGPLYLQAEKGQTDLKGKPLVPYYDEPYASSCYSGPMPILPQIALTKKLSSDLGVGLGFFPPDIAALNQWGNRDGTVDTPHGPRPNIARYFRSHLNVSFFTALAAAGYRLSDFLRIGFGFQWNVVAFESTTWARPNDDLSPHNDVKVDTFGRDLFIPGIVASAQWVPTDAIDVAVGFKWSDRVVTKAKLDLTSGPMGTGEPFFYKEMDGTIVGKNGAVPTTTHNQRGSVNSPPVWAPQLTIGVRYADRLKPRVTTKTWDEAHLAAGRTVEDSMSTERWDVEANAVVYFNSVNDQQLFSSDAKTAAQVKFVDAQPGGVNGVTKANVGSCTKVDPKTKDCVGEWQVPTFYHGKTQLSLRLGGDYNIVPGFLSVRAGVSYENDGQDIEYLNITNYMLGRTGLHAGMTMRIADKTDFSIGYAHFIQKDVRLNPNPISGPVPILWKQQPDKYNYHPKDADGVGRVEVPYGAITGDVDGPNFVNVGSFYYHLDVLAVQLTQHF